MKCLAFSYDNKIEYDSQVNQHYFSVKALPGDLARQIVKELKIEVDPIEDSSMSQDGFGNKILIGHTFAPHQHFHVLVEGTVLVSDERERWKENENLSLFRGPTYLTAMSKEMKQYEKQYFSPEQIKSGLADYMPFDAFGIADFMMKQLYQDFTYEKGVTKVNTSASQAFSFQKGVCQDYAHILLAFLRDRGYPCRYVSGLMIGEGETHAWIEVFNEADRLWYGLDPTNNLWIDENYIVLARGRDYRDCVVHKGRFLGAAGQTQSIKVKVEEIEWSK
ncbi:MAG: transglutaminase family protein [Lachnospiraceae bacterium]|nr:transglutaminase family protein [Lachnospiraceae bacterium]